MFRSIVFGLFVSLSVVAVGVTFEQRFNGTVTPDNSAGPSYAAVRDVVFVPSERLDEAAAAVRQAFDGGKIALAEHLLFDAAIKTAERSVLASSRQTDTFPTKKKQVR